MNAFADALDAIVGKLTAAGLPATRDPGALPPMVLVDLPEVTSGDHAVWHTSVPVRCVAPPPGNLDAANALLDMLEVVLTTLGSAPAFAATWLGPGGKDLPAVTVTYPTDVLNPTC